MSETKTEDLPSEDTSPAEKFAGHELRSPQVAALKGFVDWIDIIEDDEESKMGHVILPMGSGKTALGILFAEKIRERNDKKTLVISWSNDTASQFYNSANQHTAKSGSELKAGMAVAGRKPVRNANFIVSNFASQHNWPNLDEVGLIVVDEADVNGLSQGKAKLLTAIAETEKIPIVALSATDQLGETRGIAINPGVRDKLTALEKMLAEGKNRKERKLKLNTDSSKEHDPDHLLSEYEHMLLGDIESALNEDDEDLVSPSNPHEEMQEKQEMALLNKRFESVPSERQKFVLTKRFGFEDAETNPEGEDLTLDKLGEEMGISRERARQIEIDGINKLRSFLSVEIEEGRPYGSIPMTADIIEIQSEISDEGAMLRWDKMIVKGAKFEICRIDSKLFDALQARNWSTGVLAKNIIEAGKKSTDIWKEIEKKFPEYWERLKDAEYLELRKADEQQNKLVALLKAILEKTKPKTSDNPET